jgi:hypothetical protein
MTPALRAQLYLRLALVLALVAYDESIRHDKALYQKRRGGDILRRYCRIVSIFSLHVSSAGAGDIPADLMIDLDSLTVSEEEFICLALNDYFEARGESLAGRLAVAKVVMNRAMDKRYPKNVCAVIKQNKSRLSNRCQFSWYCDGLPDTP